MFPALSTLSITLPLYFPTPAEGNLLLTFFFFFFFFFFCQTASNKRKPITGLSRSRRKGACRGEQEGREKRGKRDSSLGQEGIAAQIDRNTQQSWSPLQLQMDGDWQIVDAQKMLAGRSGFCLRVPSGPFHVSLIAGSPWGGKGWAATQGPRSSPSGKS